MAYYNANEIIRLTRKALGLTQEELCEGICEVVTLSRIENGHTSVKRSTYKKLMEKMDRIPETRYAVCVSKDGVLSEDRVELERAFKRYDYEAAEYYLNRLKESADDNLMTRQYIARETALVDYSLGRVEIVDLAWKLGEAIQLTMPTYEQYINAEKVFPFTMMELMILVSQANAYRKATDIQKSIQLYQTVLRCLDARYIGEPDNSKMQLTVRNSLAIAYEKQGEYQKALSELDNCIEIAKKYDCGYAMAPLLAAKTFNIVKLVARKKLGEENMEEAKKISQQAYYIAAARIDNKIMRALKTFEDMYI